MYHLAVYMFPRSLSAERQDVLHTPPLYIRSI